MSLTIPPTDLSAIQLFNKGTEIQTEAHASQEHLKVGTLRGGSSGALVNGEIYGKCTRASLARYLGYQEPKSPDSYNFFDAGYASEWTWEGKLKESWPGTILLEEEIPISWTVPGTDVKVTGRPDIVLCDRVPVDGYPDLTQPKPVLGIELKAILAINSSVGVALENKPKTDHVIQAAHYSWQLGIPWILAYSWNVKGPVPYWAKKRFDVNEITPGKREFKLGWEEGRLFYTDETGRRVDTVITATAIEDYYRLIVDMAENKTLYRDHGNRDVDGSVLPWAHDRYCKFCQIANKSRDYDEWLDNVILMSQGE